MASERSKGDGNVIKLNGEKKIVIVTSPQKGKSPAAVVPPKVKAKIPKKVTESHKKLVKQTKAAKKTLKEMQAAEILMNYCTSMGKYFADQSVIETLMDVAVDSQNVVDAAAAEIILDLAAEASTVTGETTDAFL